MTSDNPTKIYICLAELEFIGDIIMNTFLLYQQ